MTAVNICERPLAYRLAHKIKYTIVLVREVGFLSPSGADKTDHRTIHRATDRHAACQRTATANMDPFPTLRAGAFMMSLAGVVHSSPSIFLSPTQYTTTRLSFSHERARYGPHFERAVRMSDGAFQGFLRPRLPCPGLSASVYRHGGQLPCRAPRSVFPTEGGWGGTVCSLKGRWVGRVAANSAMELGASRVGCGARVDLSGPLAAACVARSFRIVDNSFDSSCKRGTLNTQDVEFPVLRRYTAV